MSEEEFIFDSKKKKDRDKFESILRIYFDNDKLIDLIIEDTYNRDHKFSPYFNTSSSNIFTDVIREQVEPVKIMDLKVNLSLLKAEYESLDNKCWNENFTKLPKKLIYSWDLIINENISIIKNILKNNKSIKIDINLVKELEREKNHLENLFNLYDKLSYEEINNDTIVLLHEHIKLQMYAVNKKLLSTS